MKLKSIVLGMRLPFLTGSLLPVCAAWAFARHSGPIRLLDGLAILFGVACLHLGSNLLNDYFDTDRSDRINRFRTPFSGGSRVILDGTMSARGVLALVIGLFAASALVGVYLLVNGRGLVLVFGLVGLALGTLYSLGLMNVGVGELCIFLAFGPVLTLAAGYALTGTLDPTQALIGVLPGYLITAVLWINQFPDFEADSAAGKRNLVVILGKRHARWVYMALMFLPFASAAVLAALGLLPLVSLAVFLALPIVLKTVAVFWRTWDDPRAIVPAQVLTIQSHLGVTALLAIALLFARA
jgi:1,4-dihydroxy-2-naphthoate octaprenyltransferase